MLGRFTRGRRTVYVYTVVNAFGDDGGTEAFVFGHGGPFLQPANQNLLYTAQAGEAPIAKKRIYRLATGHPSSDYLYGRGLFSHHLVDNRLTRNWPAFPRLAVPAPICAI